MRHTKALLMLVARIIATIAIESWEAMLSMYDGFKHAWATYKKERSVR
jgi:hypothetical protein